MAGVVRQPIDLPALERFISENVPIIKVPLDLKQVFSVLVFSLLLNSKVI
jgi:hypothetical protein